MNEFTDDPTITDDKIVWRRIHPNWVVPDENLKGKRLSSQSFLQNGPTGHVSVFLADEAPSSQAVLQGYPGFFLVCLKVGFLRQLGLGIARDPTSGGPGHAEIIGRKTKSMLDQMAKAATWVNPYEPTL